MDYIAYYLSLRSVFLKGSAFFHLLFMLFVVGLAVAYYNRGARGMTFLVGSDLFHSVFKHAR